MGQRHDLVLDNVQIELVVLGSKVLDDLRSEALLCLFAVAFFNRSVSASSKLKIDKLVDLDEVINDNSLFSLLSDLASDLVVSRKVSSRTNKSILIRCAHRVERKLSSKRQKKGKETNK
jgi:hypothetical protein